MWQAIQYVSTLTSLCAFIVAAGVYLERSRTNAKLEAIKTVPPAERAQLVEDALEFFHIDTRELTKDQRYALAIQQIGARAKRFSTGAVVIVLVAVLLAAIAIYSISQSRSVDTLPFAVAVFAHGRTGTDDIPLRNSGYVVIDIGTARHRQAIGQSGETYFSEIPPNYRGKAVHIWVESDQYESEDPGQIYALSGTPIYIGVRRKSGEISGLIEDARGDALEGVNIQIAGLTTITDTAGRFRITVPGGSMADTLEISATRSGFQTLRTNVVPNSEVKIVLRRQR